MKFTTQTSLVRSSFTALFAAIISVGCFISIPLPGGVPITIQNMLAALSGLILGGIQGAGSVGLFILLGAIGVPVYSGGKSGLAHLVGPTGGFLWGYFLGALAAGIIVGTPHASEKKFNKMMWLRITIATIVAFALNYAPGIPWFMHIMAAKGSPKTFQEALPLTLFPFIPGEIIKIIISIPLAAIVRPMAARYLYPDDSREAKELLEELRQRTEKRQAKRAQIEKRH